MENLRMTEDNTTPPQEIKIRNRWVAIADVAKASEGTPAINEKVIRDAVDHVRQEHPELLNTIYRPAARGVGSGTPESITQQFALFLVEQDALKSGAFHASYDSDQPHTQQVGFQEREAVKRLLEGGMVDKTR
jgi:hypothetical protein